MWFLWFWYFEFACLVWILWKRVWIGCLIWVCVMLFNLLYWLGRSLVLDLFRFGLVWLLEAFGLFWLFSWLGGFDCYGFMWWLVDYVCLWCVGLVVIMWFGGVAALSWLVCCFSYWLLFACWLVGGLFV